MVDLLPETHVTPSCAKSTPSAQAHDLPMAVGKQRVEQPPLFSEHELIPVDQIDISSVILKYGISMIINEVRISF